MNLNTLKAKLLSIDGVYGVDVKENEDGVTLIVNVKDYYPKLGLSVARTIGKELAKTIKSKEQVPVIDWDYKFVSQ